MTIAIQELFDRVAGHLLSQNDNARVIVPTSYILGIKSQGFMTHCHIDSAGRKSPIGFLVPNAVTPSNNEEFVHPFLGALDEAGIIKVNRSPEGHLSFPLNPSEDQKERLLASLTGLHNATPAARWNAGLRAIAHWFKLDVSKLPIDASPKHARKLARKKLRLAK